MIGKYFIAFTGEALIGSNVLGEIGGGRHIEQILWVVITSDATDFATEHTSETRIRRYGCSQCSLDEVNALKFRVSFSESKAVDAVVFGSLAGRFEQIIDHF